MAINFAGANTSPYNNDKDVHVRVFKLTSANFTVTTATETLLGVLPADSTILSFNYWNKTKLAGGSVSAATLSLGTASAGTEFVETFDVFTTVGTQAILSPVTGIMQPYAVPQGGDIQIWASGLATTGTPTSGEIYVTVTYVR